MCAKALRQGDKDVSEIARRCIRLLLGGIEKEQWQADLERGNTSRALQGTEFELDSLFSRQPLASFK